MIVTSYEKGIERFMFVVCSLHCCAYGVTCCSVLCSIFSINLVYTTVIFRKQVGHYHRIMFPSAGRAEYLEEGLVPHVTSGAGLVCIQWSISRASSNRGVLATAYMR